MKKALIIIAADGFQEYELNGTRDGLTAAGFEIILGSTRVGPCTGKSGASEIADIALPDVEITDYDRIAFIGGPGARALWDDGDAIGIAKDTVEAGKPLGAICIAPGILANAGVLKGKNATIWNPSSPPAGGSSGQVPSESVQCLIDAGAVFTNEPVTRDGLIVTANGPKAAEEFGRVFAAL